MKLINIKRKIIKFFQKPESLNLITKDINSTIQISESAIVTNCTITLTGNSSLKIAEKVRIEDYNITIHDGHLSIGEESLLNRGYQSLNKPRIQINDGQIIIGKCNVIRAEIDVRFGGVCEIGIYNGICENTEIRADEYVKIGDFNMISYECIIFDTNTHVIYESDIRKQMTIKDFPNIGYEREKPITKAVNIKNFCWIGKRAVILKGTTLNDDVVVGTNSVISNKTINSKSLVYGNPAIAIERKIDLV